MTRKRLRRRVIAWLHLLPNALLSGWTNLIVDLMGSWPAARVSLGEWVRMSPSSG
jgi:hypothetical protein